MQIPTPAMASPRLLKLGRYHLAALAESAETAPLAAPFQTAQDDLAAKHAARTKAEEALPEHRVAVAFAEAALEQVIRRVASAARDADGGTSGPAFAAVCPGGLDAEVRPRGDAQARAGDALAARLDTQPAAAAVKAAHLGDLQAAVALLKEKLAGRKGALETIGLAFAAELGARETFCSAYDGNAGAVRQLFPRQRARQDLYFDTFRPSRSGSDDEDEDE